MIYSCADFRDRTCHCGTSVVDKDELSSLTSGSLKTDAPSRRRACYVVTWRNKWNLGLQRGPLAKTRYAVWGTKLKQDDTLLYNC